MIQSPNDQGRASGTHCPSNDGHSSAFIYRVCLTLLITLTLAGGLFAVKTVPSRAAQSPASSVDPIKSTPLSDSARKENSATAAAASQASTHVVQVADDANELVSFSVTTVGGARLNDDSNDRPRRVAFAHHVKAFVTWDDIFAPAGPAHEQTNNSLAFAAPLLAFAPPNITITSSCDTFGNSLFTIKNTGGAMTVDYTWELYQNNGFLTSGSFRLTAAGTAGDSTQLSANGLYNNLTVLAKDNNGTQVASSTVFCVQRPNVSIKQAAGQVDPTTTSPIKFDVTFDKPVTGFTGSDVTITGMAATPGVSVTDSGDHQHFSVAVTGMADLETVVATIPQDAAFDANGLGNVKSSQFFTDHSVTYHAPPVVGVTATCDLYANSLFTISNTGGAMYTNYTWELYQSTVFLTSGSFQLTKGGTTGDSTQLSANGLLGSLTVKIKDNNGNEIASATTFCVDSSPTVTVNQGATQPDPTKTSPITFDVVFSAAVSGFIASDVNVTGMVGTQTKTLTDSGDHIHYTFTVAGMASGETVRASIPAGRAFVTGHSGTTNKASTFTDNSVTFDNTGPTVTLNQASGQADPAQTSPIHFDAVFSEPVSGFTSSDLSITGMSHTPGVTLTDSGDHKHFSVAVTGMVNGEKVFAKLGANVASDAAGNLSAAATSTDDNVTFNDTTPPAVTVEQKFAQPDPTNSGPIHFVATFSEPINVSSFSNTDVTLGGTAGATTATVTEIAPNDHTTFDISVSGMTGDGTVTASIFANKVSDVNGNLNSASTSTDNTVAYDTTPPTVTIEQAAGQDDPASNSPINFEVVFSEPVTGFSVPADVIITGTAGATTIKITGGDTVYNVAVSGMTKDGTVIVNIPASAAQDLAHNLSAASTSVDNTVTFKFCAANPIVTSNADSGPNTLRDALANICAAPSNNVTFDLGGPGGNTIALTTGQLEIQKDVNITNVVSSTNGPLTIAANTIGRVFLNESGVTTNITGLTITNGNLINPGETGAGIRNDGTLTLSKVIVTGNHAATQGEGGGIYNSGTLTITDSTVSNNIASGGGLGAGIESVGGSVSMTNCTLSANSGAHQGGGIRNTGGSLTIVNSTITLNSAVNGAGIYNDATGSLTITNSTISRNSAVDTGGGIYNSAGTVSLRNSIDALNTTPTSGADIFGAITSQGFNLIGNNSDATITPNTGDQIGTTGSPIDPLLGILGDYGGPTQTLRLLSGSPAIDQGNSSGSAFDQRGLPRPIDQTEISNVDDGADIGAYEMALEPTITPGGATTFCDGNNVTLTSSSATGNQWFLNGNPIPGETNQSYLATASGDYTVEVDSVTSVVTTVTVNTIPSTPTITPGGPTTFCAGGNVTLTSSSANGNQWYLDGNPIGGAISQLYTATVGGDYTVVETTAGCSSAASTPLTVVLTPAPPRPTITPSGPTTFCDGDNVILNSSSATGNQWFLNGNPIGGATDENYIATASGNYTVVTSSNGCPSAPSAATVVTVKPSPLAPVITPGGPTSFCVGGSVTLSSNSASGNQWYLDGNPIGGATGPTYVATVTGNYTDGVTASGCSSSTSAPISVTASPIPPAPTINAGGSTTFCDGGSVTLTSSSAGGNQWYLDGNPIGGATNQNYVAIASGSYTVLIINNGCASAASAPTVVTVNPIPPAPTITAGGPASFCDGGSVTLTSSSAKGNQWYLDGNPIGGATGQTYIANASGDYTVKVTESNCTSPSSAPTVVTVKPGMATVINTNDLGAGSLRQAIADVCDGGMIDFNLGSGPHTIALSSELSIAGSVTIANTVSNANGPLTISGNNTTRVFNLNVPAPGIISLSGLTIANGNGGAGAGGGILNGNTGNLSITNSTLSGNTATTGGAIHNSSTGIVNITNSTVSLNTAIAGGGGISNAQTGAINITNSTISNNSVTGQGGGIFNFGGTPVRLRNTIVALNTAVGGGGDVAGSTTSQGHNLIGNNTGATITPDPGDQIGTDIAPINPRLGPLQDNGGATQTRALLAGSPALDAGDNCVTEATHCSDPDLTQLTTDQRGAGFARLRDAAAGDNTPIVDIGAVEADPSIEDIPDRSTPEDTPLTLIFKLGDGQSAFDSIAATSGNPTLVPNASLSIGADTAATRTLSITPAPNQTGTATITVTVTKTVAGTVQSISDTFVLTVTPVNDKPSNSVPGAQTVIENGSLTFSAAKLNQISISDIDAGSNPMAVTLTATNGTLTLNGTAGLTFVPATAANDGTDDALLSFEGTIADINTALNGMTFTPTPGYQGPANIQILTSDKGATGSPGPQVASDSVSINVLSGGTIAFAAPAFTVSEAAGTATITVVRTGGSSGEARINYATSNGTALAGAGNDYLAATGQLIFPDGVTTRTFAVTIQNDLLNEPAETVNLTLANATGSATLGTPDTAVLTIVDDDPLGGYIKFSSPSYNVAEDAGSATITVERVGTLTQPATINYATTEKSGAAPCTPTPGNTIASSRCDFDTAMGQLSFAAGDGSPKTITVLINQDSYVEGPEDLQLTLSNPTGGATLASPGTATLTITDDDLTAPATNAIDDPSDFVRQHYHDFLNREPDPAGLAFWTNEITSCGTDASCIELKRINVSAAFFLSVEFQATGRTAYLTNKVAFGGLPTYVHFESDFQAIGRNYVFGQPGAESILEANKEAYFNDYVSRTEFRSTYNGLSDQAFVNTLISNTGVEFTQLERDALLNGLVNHTETRATVLRKISEKPSFAQAEFNRMFVLMQYLGYLRRNPNEGQDSDFTGYNFWLQKLNQANGNFIDAEMVKAFVYSIEYRQRFGR